MTNRYFVTEILYIFYEIKHFFIAYNKIDYSIYLHILEISQIK